MHVLTADFARLVSLLPEQMSGRAAVASDSGATAQFLSVIAGSVPVEAVFALPEAASAA